MAFRTRTGAVVGVPSAFFRWWRTGLILASLGTLPALVALPYLSWFVGARSIDRAVSGLVRDSVGLSVLVICVCLLALGYVAAFTLPYLLWERGTALRARFATVLGGVSARWLMVWLAGMGAFLLLLRLGRLPTELALAAYLLPWLAALALVGAWRSLGALAVASRRHPLYHGIDLPERSFEAGYGPDFPTEITPATVSEADAVRYERLARDRKASRELLGYIITFVFGGFFATSFLWAVGQRDPLPFLVPPLLLLFAAAGYLLQRSGVKYERLAERLRTLHEQL